MQHGVSLVFGKDRGGGVTGRIYGEGRLVSKGGRWWRGWRRRGIHCRLGRIFPRSEVLRRSFWLLAKVQVRERLVGWWRQEIVVVIVSVK